MTMRSGFVFSALVSLAASMACQKTAEVRATSTIEIDPSSTSVEVDGSLASSYLITIRNTGQNRTLNISEILLDVEGDTAGVFTLSAFDLPAGVSPQGEGGANETYEFRVDYQPAGDSATHTAVVTIRNDNTESAAAQSLQIRFQTRLCEPTLLAPAKVDFELVTLETKTGTEDVQLTNTGSCRLVIDWIMVEGSSAFTLDLGDGVTFKGSETGEVIALDPPVTIDANSGAPWSAVFEPTDCNSAQAVVTVHSNDTGAVDGKRQIELVGNSTGPRLEILPPRIEFGGKRIGNPAGVDVELKSIGTQAVVITGIAMKADSSLDFSIDYAELPGGVAPTAEAPLTIEVNESVKFLAKYVPDVKNPLDGSGSPLLDIGAIEFKTNTCSSLTELSVSGYGIDADCPQPIIVIEEGEDAKPQDIIHLHGEQSQAASGTITKYSWKIKEQPADNKFALVPAANFPTPTHEVNVGGTYEYCLDVCDSGNACSSDPQCKTTACKTVSVVPDEAIHCELTWNTQGDDDQFDSGPDAGADMDLHFLHPFATGPDLDGDTRPDGWFDIPYDVFWYNKTPEWESSNPNVADNPTLDRDDTDGAGPENVNLRAPANGREYRIGVHYWDDHGFGFSYPRLKCFIYGEKVFDRDLAAVGGGKPMSKCDMWEAATIKWPQGMVTAVQKPDGSLKITPNYMNNAFVVVGGSSCGQP